MTGYCGTCRVRFTTLEEWAEHQHQSGIFCTCGRPFGSRQDQAADPYLHKVVAA